jgi:hypothetical protein
MNTKQNQESIFLTDSQQQILDTANDLRIRVAVAEWNPNGTNDVLFCIDDQVIGSLDEALFGFRIESCRAGTYQFCLYGESLISESGESIRNNASEDAQSTEEVARISSLDSGDALTEFSEKIDSPFYHWTTISLEEAIERLALSPVLDDQQALNRFLSALKGVL